MSETQSAPAPLFEGELYPILHAAAMTAFGISESALKATRSGADSYRARSVIAYLLRVKGGYTADKTRACLHVGSSSHYDMVADGEEFVMGGQCKPSQEMLRIACLWAVKHRKESIHKRARTVARLIKKAAALNGVKASEVIPLTSDASQPLTVARAMVAVLLHDVHGFFVADLMRVFSTTDWGARKLLQRSADRLNSMMLSHSFCETYTALHEEESALAE